MTYPSSHCFLFECFLVTLPLYKALVMMSRKYEYKSVYTLYSTVVYQQHKILTRQLQLFLCKSCFFVVAEA